jgi:pSer/pThr/pTyr-binding forkhead associated (FHA) protein
MPFEFGVVCGRCDRYSSLGSTKCACGDSLALDTEPRPQEAPETRTSNARLGVAPPAVQAAAGLSEPPLSLFATDELRPRRTASSLSNSAAGAVAGRVVERESALSSSLGFDDDGAANDRVAPARSDASPEELMDQAKNYVCRSCSTPVPLGHKFCGRCGAAIPPEIVNARTQFFGQLQMPGKAKLILIRGDGIEGLSYQLNAEQHVVGRTGQLVFPDDAFVSPRHANLFYRAGKLVVRDEGSLNGVFCRVRGTVELASGDFFLAGEQLFRIEGPARANDGPAPDGTYFYSSPKHQSQFKIIQMLEGGAAGMAVCARGNGLQIGREGGDLNFPGDLYMSASHCKLEESGGRLSLTDLNSRNGTYVRLKAEKELAHGDYLFIGRKLLRVEITAN